MLVHYRCVLLSRGRHPQLGAAETTDGVMFRSNIHPICTRQFNLHTTENSQHKQVPLLVFQAAVAVYGCTNAYRDVMKDQELSKGSHYGWVLIISLLSDCTFVAKNDKIKHKLYIANGQISAYMCVCE